MDKLYDDIRSSALLASVLSAAIGIMSFIAEIIAPKFATGILPVVCLILSTASGAASVYFRHKAAKERERTD